MTETGEKNQQGSETNLMQRVREKNVSTMILSTGIKHENFCLPKVTINKVRKRRDGQEKALKTADYI